MPVPRLTDEQIERLIAACQKVSAMAPQSEPPNPEDVEEDYGDYAESLCLDMGLWHAAEVIRGALSEVGVTPAEGTAGSWNEENVDDNA